jgi:type II secretory pathway component PulF
MDKQNVMKNKKGVLQNVYPIVMGLVVIGVLLGIGLLILSKFQGSMTAGTNESLAVGETVTALRTVSQTWLPIIVIVSIASLILFLVIRGFGGGMRGAR